MTTFDQRHPDHLVRVNKLGTTCIEDGCTGEFISWHDKIAENEGDDDGTEDVLPE